MKHVGRSLVSVVTVALLALAASSRPLLAQSVTGTILGTVSDTSGGVIAGAKVTVVNEGTALTRTVRSDANGEYTAPALPTGHYSLLVESTGFKQLTLSNVEVGVDQRVRMDLKLDVGAMTDSVSITAETPLLQTSSSELGTTIGNEQIEALPLNGRNFVNLTRTVPGVLRGIPGANIDGAGSLAWRASASFSANGQRPRDNNYMLDGVDNNETWLQTVVVFPSVDALDEFKLQTSTYSAEFGRSLGGVVNLQIKSGTNQLRGWGFEFHRDDAFDANNFFNNRAGREKPDFKQNQFGGTVGGPVFKDKTFFFADYQGHRETQGQTFLSTVPTLAMRGGDFSQLNRVIYDPLTGQPFPGNVIPGDRIDTVARNILTQLYPEPNTTGSRQANGQVIDNYLINPIKERQDNQFDVKVDHNLTTANRFFTRYSFEKTHRIQPATLPHGDAGATFGAGDRQHQGPEPGVQRHPHAALESPQRVPLRMVLDQVLHDVDRLRHQPGGRGRHSRDQPERGHVRDDAADVPEHPEPRRQQQPAAHHQPERLPDLRQRDLDQRQAHHQVRRQRHAPLARDPQRRHDRRCLQLQQQHDVQLRRAAGAGCSINSATGFDVASFMLGLVNTKNRTLFDANTYTEKRPEFSLYIQDDYRVASRLTLNLGLRWDVYPPWIEVNDRQSNFDQTTGKFVVASDDAVIDGIKVGRYLQTYSKRDVGPRFGFAYDLDGSGKTLVRGGFGVFWNFTPGGTSSSKAQNPPFLQSTSLTPTPTAYGANLLLKDGLPPPPGVDPNRPAAGATRSIFDVNFRDAYARQWNINVQRSLSTNYLVEVAYVGSQGRQMLAKGDPNQAPPVVGVIDANVNRPYATISPALRSIGQVQSVGTLDYNGLLVKFQRRFANNFSFLNSYTYGKAIDLNSDNDGTVTFTNVYDPQYNRGPADYDVTHSFSSSWVYELPWAREKLYGGWQLSGILSARGGLPLTVTTAQGVQSTGTGNRPNRSATATSRTRPSITGSTPVCFVPTADITGTYGDAGRGIIRGPGSFNIDASIIKNTKIGRLATEIRIEAFNVLNHPQFANPNTTIGNAAVGTISAMLSSPSCSLCGTTERQVQLGVKVKF